ncbi:MAG: GntR family transcriptional regulator [Methylocystaceae bacterium]|nr:GntR family transcriptional regulator [Methylocystaceae bacterium]
MAQVKALGETKTGTKHHQLFLLLKDEIISNLYRPGCKLPGELKLAEQYGVSRVTVRAAIKALADAGFVDRKPGLGTIVKESVVKSSVMHASIADLFPSLERMGRDSQVRLLEFGYEIPTRTVSNELNLQENDKTQRSVRVRLLENVPFSYLITHVPESIAHNYNESDLATTPLFRLLEKSGIKIDSAKQHISAVLASQHIAEALDVAIGSPLIYLNRVVYDINGAGVEYLDAYYRPDKYQLRIDLSRTGEEDSRHWTAELNGGN